MDSNVMTISNILIQPNATSPVSSNLGAMDVKKEDSRFLVKQDQEPMSLKGTSDNNPEIGSLENNRFAVRKEQTDDPANPDNFQKTQNSTESEKKEFSKSKNDDNLTDPEYKITLGSLVREVARNNEPGGGRRLSQLISSFKENRILPITAQATKSAANKQLLPTNSNQTGIKTILSEKLKGRIALKNDFQTKPANASSNNSSRQTLTVSTISNQGNGITLKPEVFGENSPKKATQFDKKQMDSLSIKKGASENEVNNAGKTSITNTKLSLSQASSLQSVDKASELRRKIIDGDEEKFLSTKNKPNDHENTGSRRLKEFLALKETPQQVKGSVNGSNNEKSNILNAQVSGEQIRMKNHSTSDDDMSAKVAQNNIHQNMKTVTVDQSVSATENHVKNGNFTKTGISSEVPDNIGKQILESIHSSLSRQGADKQISVRLNPPELGKVFIKFHEQDNQITGLLEVSKTQTRSEIEQILPQIVRHLSDSGVNIKRLEVVLTNSDQAEQETLKDTSFFSNQQQHHNFNDSGLYDGDQDMSRIHEWLANNVNFENNAGLRDALTVDSSINILI
jgi:flagellar hook-length control protein FliK